MKVNRKNEPAEVVQYFGLTLNLEVARSLDAEKLRQMLHSRFGHGKWADKLVEELVKDHIALREAKF